MKTADLITSYVNNEMTPEQERQFLLSVAASDSLRLSLKSHFMLDRIVSTQAQGVHVPEHIRTSILAQATAATGGTFSERNPGNGAITGRMTRFGRMFGRGTLMGLILASGFAAGYFTRSEVAPMRTATAVPTVQQTARPSAADFPQTSLRETSPSADAAPASAEPVTGHQLSASGPGAAHTVATNAVRRGNNGRPVNPTIATPNASGQNPAAPEKTGNAADRNQQGVTDGKLPHSSASADVTISKPGSESGQAGQDHQGGPANP